ncbi:dnaJ homolog subfamily C member 17 isoform X2 [Alosa alosa]|uniref:dnaJ homolog subfamily C member 17 isoform X2 n=1 Tax=Alosa sapidissima TaxID=34773 RepID=UPI001C0A3DC8|nr:dnaJ homolog subfamily C member 17 isoform X2 [Alosa sapidissima]XP_048083641.1 dnaJ homolog subfamily C member 17 isoform X2 [Alosa alosa]
MAATKELLQMDLYGLLEVDETASSKDIKKAYRQKALKCHPDKNPDNPKAADLFHQLSQALEVLTDAAARAAYDKVRAAKKRAVERTQRLDDKRKKIKLDLEARERRAEAHNAEEVKITRTLEEEITRLREEGSRQLQEEQKLIQEQIEREKAARLHTDGSHIDGGAGNQGGGSATPKLKYGDVLNVLISSKKKGSAVVEFASAKAADLAFKNESGLMGNPLKISWLEGQPEAPPITIHKSDPGSMFTHSQASLTSGRDYESLVLMRMRQAAERQKLIEEMQREDEENEEEAVTAHAKPKAKA